LMADDTAFLTEDIRKDDDDTGCSSERDSAADAPTRGIAPWHADGKWTNTRDSEQYQQFSYVDNIWSLPADKNLIEITVDDATKQWTTREAGACFPCTIFQPLPGHPNSLAYR